MRLGARGRRGVYLLQTVVFVIILAMAVSVLMHLSLGRFVVSGRMEEGQRARSVARAVESRVQACLSGSSYGSPSCALTAAQQTCIPTPTTIDGRAVTVTGSGTSPNCNISIDVGDAP